MQPLFQIQDTHRTYAIYLGIMFLMAVFAFENLRTLDFWDGWDDRGLIEDVKRAQNEFSHLFSRERDPVRPTTDFVFLLGYVLWGENPVAFRFLQIFLHFLASLIAVYTFKKMKIDLELSLVAGLFFLLNVAHFRAIHWITCISFPLSLIFALLVIIIYVSPNCKNRLIRQILASLALLFGIFAHPGVIVVVPFCACVVFAKTGSIKQTILEMGIVLTVALVGMTLAIWISPKANQTSLLSQFDGFATLFQNFLWYVGRLFSSAIWLTKTTVSNSQPLSEMIFGALICIFFLFVRHRSPKVISVWILWVILFILVFFNNPISRLAVGPSRHLYFASLGSSLILAWVIREIIQQVSLSRTTQQSLFALSILVISITSIFFVKKAEALAIYLAGRGHAYLIFEDRANAKKAAHLFAHAIRHAPGLVPEDIFVRLAAMGFAIGEPYSEVFEEASLKFPKNETLVMLQGVASYLDPDERHWQTGEIKILQALDHLQNKNDLKSNIALAFNNLAGYYSNQREYDKAVRLFKKAIEYNPYHMTAYTNMGLALNALGKTEEALDIYRQAIGLRPEYVAPLQNLANALLEKGDLQAALPFFQELARIDSTNGNAQYNLGIVLISMGDLPQAEKMLSTAIRLNPSDAQALHKLGIVKYAQHHFSEAAQVFQTASELAPNDIEIHLQWAESLRLSGNPEAALAVYKTILERHPAHHQTLQKSSALLLEQNHPAEALDLFNRALAFNSASAETWYLLAHVYQEIGDLENLQTALRNAIRHAPHERQYIESYLNLGGALQQRGNLDDARKIYGELIAYAPNLPDIHINLGILNFSQQRYEEAVGNFLRATELAPDDPEVHLGLAQAYEKTGQPNRARTAYQRTLTLQPENPMAQTRLRELK